MEDKINRIEDILVCQDIEKLRAAALDFYDRLQVYNKKFKAIKIKCLTNGKVYDSIRQAAIDLRLNDVSIRHVLKGKYSQTGGYVFVRHRE